ncbi:GlxA family transcriptional regulator [Mesorhizobium sp. CN2-181]|uniref:GlxA family transcriptional regulator n=1 Tax=Mesorhizobium yinganensis TaxID=3157707 RepID=UPI0032B731EE
MTYRFAFVLAREFTLSPLAMFIDTLRLAGDEGDRSRRVLFDWQIVGDRGLPIRSSSGLEMMPTATLGDPGEYDHIVLVGGLLGAPKNLGATRERFILDAAKRGLPLTALCTASFHFARLGLLDGYEVCVSLFHLAQFHEEFPNVSARAVSLFSVDRNRATCSGGAGAADLASHFVRERAGDQPVEKAAKILQLDRIRSLNDLQPGGDLFADASNRMVRRALLLMQGVIEESIDVEEIADRLSLSRRQLERLFASDLQISPKAAFMQLRIREAERLLKTTKLPISQIGLRCGFVSPQHFSRVFVAQNGLTPTQVRQALC